MYFTITIKCNCAEAESAVCSFGLPEVLASDNGPNLFSTEFKEFLHQNGVKQVISTGSSGLKWFSRANRQPSKKGWQR